MLHGHSTLMMSVWLPPNGSSPVTVAAELQTAELGLVMQTVILTDVPPPPPKTSVRRVVLECPQKPGIVLAVTELLKDSGCKISDMDAHTSVKEGEIWFRLECIVEAPSSAEEQLEEQLRWMTASEEMRATITFDRCAAATM